MVALHMHASANSTWIACIGATLHARLTCALLSERGVDRLTRAQLCELGVVAFMVALQIQTPANSTWNA